MASSIAHLRSEVIEKSINVEWLMHVMISQHYFGKVVIGFVSEVLYDEYCAFALKRRVLLKICPELQGEIENKLNRLNAIRNVFAHVGQEVRDGPDSTAGMARVPSPKDFSKSIDFGALHEEFLALEGPVTRSLFAAYERKGGVSVKGAEA